jgi:hypothetical protein
VAVEQQLKIHDVKVVFILPNLQAPDLMLMSTDIQLLPLHQRNSGTILHHLVVEAILLQIVAEVILLQPEEKTILLQIAEETVILQKRSQHLFFKIMTQKEFTGRGTNVHPLIKLLPILPKKDFESGFVWFVKRQKKRLAEVQ